MFSFEKDKFDKIILGKCFGVGIEHRTNDKGQPIGDLLTLLVEDDGCWHLTTTVFDEFWINDIIDVLRKALKESEK